MAVSKGRESQEGSQIKRYIGVAPVYVLAVNPTRKKLSEFYGTDIDKEPEYVGKTTVNSAGKSEEVPNVRIEFLLRTVSERCDGIDFISRVSFFLSRHMRLNNDGTKLQVIDKYGRTAWVTREQMKSHEIPVYSNGPANLDKDYRPCYMGEENLINFLRTYLNIPSVMTYNQNTKTWKMVERPEECEARLDRIENYFKGDFSELEEAVAMQPNNKVKVLFGVRSNENGNIYQDVFKEMPLRNGVTDYSRLSVAVAERKDSGAYKDTVFEICELKPYEVTPTDLSKSKNEGKDDDDLPFKDDDKSPWDQFNN